MGQSILARSARLLWAIAASLLVTGAAAAAGPVYPAPEAVKALAPGSQVPSARVATVNGESLDLAEAVREQGALLVFYRGGW